MPSMKMIHNPKSCFLAAVYFLKNEIRLDLHLSMWHMMT